MALGCDLQSGHYCWNACRFLLLLPFRFCRRLCPGKPLKTTLRSSSNNEGDGYEEVALLQTLSRLFHLVQFVKCWRVLLELNLKRLYGSSGKEKGSRCLVLTSSTKREIRYFHVVVVQWRQRNVEKSVMHVQSRCFACLRACLRWGGGPQEGEVTRLSI